MKLNLSNENIVALTENIVQSVNSYVRAKGLRIVFHTDVEEKVIACDPEKIERVVLNLLSNAIKFSNYWCIFFTFSFS
jgi:signal transduction histidine kinase